MNVNILKIKDDWYEWVVTWAGFSYWGCSTSKHGAWCSIRARYHEFGLTLQDTARGTA